MVVPVLGFTPADAATPAPRVTSVCLSSGPPCPNTTSGPAAGGTTVIVTGTNFTGASAVTFGPGKPAKSFTVNSATQITAVSPPGSGTVDVQVTTPSGTSMVQLLDLYTYAATLTLDPTQVILPADGSMEGAVTATVSTGGSPVSGVTVTGSESTPSKGAHALTSCTTNSSGQCLIFTQADSTQETGTLTATATGYATGTAKILYQAPGSAPTGLTMTISNGNGAAASPVGGDVYSDGNRYFAEETSGKAAQYENTQAEAVAAVTMVNGSTPLTTGVEPYAVNWTIKNTSADTSYIAAIANVAESPYTNVICSYPTMSDPNGSLNCTPSSYDLDDNVHFSNPADPSFEGIGANNNTMAAACSGPPGCSRAVAANTTVTFTTYMVGEDNDAMVVLDSATNLPVTAQVSAQLATDPFNHLVEGTTFGNVPQASLHWAPPATGSSVSGTVSATNPAEGTVAAHDWVVLSVSGTPTLVNFGQTGSQTYTANATPVSQSVFENDLAVGTSTSLAVTNYGAANQANALTGTGFLATPTVTGLSQASGPAGGGTATT
ncbi:MAG TPA: IPT/TIG domain-containing protein, partial [Acidimicrobiales bacterium]|nr:IPT/TIG domain-containing protein [Acidimicrobiales bacterium]